MNKYLWILSLSLYYFFPVGITTGQTLQLSFHQLTTQNGLSEANNAFIYKDSRGFVWISSADGLNRFDGLTVKVYRPRPGDPYSLRGNIITSTFFEDIEGNLWFTTYNAIHKYDRKKDRFDRMALLKNDSGKAITEDYYAFHLDKKGQLWVRTGVAQAGTLHWFDIHTQKDSILGPLNGQRIAAIPNTSGNPQTISTFIPLKDGFELTTFSPEFKQEIIKRPTPNDWDPTRQSKAVFPESDTLVWVVLGSELLAFNPTTLTHTSYASFKGQSLAKLSSIAAYGEDRLFIGSLTAGIFVFDKTQRRFIQNIIPGSNNPQSLPYLQVNDLYVDDHQNLWVSSWDRGIAYANLNKHKFPILLDGASVSVIFEDENQLVWCGTSDGLFVYDQQRKLTRHLPFWETLYGQRNDTIIEFLFRADDELLAFSGPKLLAWDGQKGLFKQQTVFGLSPYEVYPLREGKILIAFGAGLFSLEKINNSYRVFPFKAIGEKQSHFFTQIFEDQSGRLFLAENRNRLLVLEKDGESYQMLYDIQDVGDIKAFYEDPQSHDIWMAGSQGLSLLAANGTEIRPMGAEDGIPNETYVQVIGHQGHLWLSGKSGLIQFFPKEKTHKRYSTTDGLLTTTANLNAIYQDQRENIWLGSQRGINIIPAEEISPVPYPPDIQITQLWINDQQMTDSQYIGERIRLELPYRENTLSFEFAALEYSEANKNQFKYRLKGYEDSLVVIHSGEKGFVRYPNLPPKDYELEIYAANSDGVWTEAPKRLFLTIHPPFWQTWWFRGLVLLAIAAIIWGLYRTQLNRQLAQAEAERLRELDDFKNRLYTNITHEFRTPLTVILGMVNVFKDNATPAYQQSVRMIRQNSQKLLRLVNQILDLAKLESGHLKLDLVQKDIIAHLFYLAESFQHYAESQGIQLVIKSEVEELVMDFDENKIQDIVANLLSNAIKFTPEKGIISVNIRQVGKAENSPLEIVVKDSGVGISAEHLPHIFERFYQVDNSVSLRGEGTGVGLALCKELIDLMEGHIEAASVKGQGTTFTITLPVKRQVVSATDTHSSVIPQEELAAAYQLPQKELTDTTVLDIQQAPEDAPLLLIIEDNPDIITYIQTCLGSSYQIITALNGQLGIDKAIEQIPDVIISDVMMPKKNGFEVCETLKTDERTSHIPIILLTAKVSQKDKVTGLRYGADAYLNKPFDKEELMVRLERLIDLRQKLQKKYSDRLFAASAPIPQPAEDLQSLDDIFIEKLRKIVLENLDNPKLGIADLCDVANLSHTQVFRKLKALTGRSPSRFIRSIRLQKGLELLQTTHLNVSEIAYDVGFNSPGYFYRTFLEEFGKTPSEIVRPG
jgi:signal transduction histidine kinase/DNA-binding response OmpR family regulator